ncbi:MAG: hypothetical protein IJ473_03015 [Alphaproteobacteria bacterium]|nr:hypothetical protein [Alphaproteobacteria bacterium]MBR4316934.1 hypothetical protein [Alphaproteobacteria bacterium]
MFSGNFKFLMILLSIIGGLFIISKLKYFILFISWTVIIFCLGILYIKANSQNKELQAKIDFYFNKFMNSKFVAFLIAIRDRFQKQGRK